MKKLLFLILVLCFSVFQLAAKTKKYGTWIEFELNKKLFKNFELSVIPEIRLEDNFSVDEYMVDAQLGYEPIKNIDFAIAYRINNNVKTKGNEITTRWTFDGNAKKELGRFEGALRLRLASYSEDEDGIKKASYLRPRFKIRYDIKNNKITPFASFELFRNLRDKEFQKARFDFGASRKIGKIHRVALYYRLQDYWASERNSIHILGIDYRLKF